jgi:thiosulfate/3-mercaptopyruvate sulfurtransferase
LRSGSIPNSKCLPFKEVINIDNTFKSCDEIREIFKENIKDVGVSNVVFSCGSGVTACVLALAYSLINVKYMPTIYDGSWAEFGRD